MASNVSEREEREGREPRLRPRERVEAAELGKELFMGNFRLDLIHPSRRPTTRRREGERFLERLRAFLGARGPAQIERDAKIPTSVVRA